MLNIQKQPLQCVIIFKESQAVTLAKSLVKNCKGVPIQLVKLRILSLQFHKWTPS